MSLSVRRAGPEDLAFLVAANLAMARETEGRELSPERLEAGVLAVLTEPAHGHYLVAESDGQRAGCLLVTYEWSDWRNGLFWWIQSVYVAPSARRQGVFRALYRATEAAAKAAAACGLRLYVEQHNLAAQQTYERLGMHACKYRMYERSFVD